MQGSQTESPLLRSDGLERMAEGGGTVLDLLSTVTQGLRAEVREVAVGGDAEIGVDTDEVFI